MDIFYGEWTYMNRSWVCILFLFMIFSVLRILIRCEVV
jgi:hypothetical protein